jgi:hypothetical protein
MGLVWIARRSVILGMDDDRPCGPRLGEQILESGLDVPSWGDGPFSLEHVALSIDQSRAVVIRPSWRGIPTRWSTS